MDTAESMTPDKKPTSHQKHTKLSKPEWGGFGRKEIAIVGTTCSSVKQLAINLSEKVSPRYNVAYADAEHNDEGHPDTEPVPGAGLIYTERHASRLFDFRKKLNNYQIRSMFNEQDLVIVNGNHFTAQHQIVVIDPRKPLKERQDQLTGVKLIILQEGIGEVPQKIKQMISGFGPVPVYRMDETEQIAREVEKIIRDSVPLLSGLVLAGGKSTRMSADKTILEYHGKPQRNHLYEMLGNYCDQVFLSCRQEQAEELSTQFNTIPDSFTGMGPMGGLLSAFRANPDRAWLAVACDLPLLSHKSLEHLTANRNPSKTATAYKSKENNFPEPLITIWEPKSYSILLHFLSLGYSCPRKILINSDIELLEAPDFRELTNVNRPEEYEKVLGML